MAVKLPYAFRSDGSSLTGATYSLFGQITRNGTKATIPLKLEIDTRNSSLTATYNRTLVVYNAVGVKLDSYEIKNNAVWLSNIKYTYYPSFTYDLGTTDAGTITVYFFIEGAATSCRWTNRSFCLDVEIDIPAANTETSPYFSQQPVSAAVIEGETATLSCQLTGGTPSVYSYQWQMRTSASEDFSDLDGETNRQLNVVTHRSENNCQYRCKGSNGYFDVYSNIAYVTGMYPPILQSMTGTFAVPQGRFWSFAVSYEPCFPENVTVVFQTKAPGSETWKTMQQSASKTYGIYVGVASLHGTLVRAACYNDANAADPDKWSYSSVVTGYVIRKPVLVQDLPETIHVSDGGRFSLSAEATCIYPTEVPAQWEVKDAGSDEFIPLDMTGNSINVTVDDTIWNGRLIRCVFYNEGFPASSLPCVTRECLVILSSPVKNPSEINLSSSVSGGDVSLSWNYGLDGDGNTIVGYQIWYAVKPSGANEYSDFHIYDIVDLVSSCDIDLTRCDAQFSDTVIFFVQAVGVAGVNESPLPSLDAQIGQREVLYGGVMRIRHNGEWKTAIPYVKYNGTWRNAIPYCKHNGTWKVTG